ncbi:hypothetical protein KY343_02760 [Candidatus Woesearchaeota archaeon]|nr:hypothetical protein [Candidatus Woesearchaeota archaeon]
MEKTIEVKKETSKLLLSFLIVLILCFNLIAISYSQSLQSGDLLWPDIKSMFKFLFGGLTSFAIGGANGYYYYYGGGGGGVCTIKIIKLRDMDGDGVFEPGDGDGLDNGWEFFAGAQPDDPIDIPSERIDDGIYKITAECGKTYTVAEKRRRGWRPSKGEDGFKTVICPPAHQGICSTDVTFRNKPIKDKPPGDDDDDDDDDSPTFGNLIDLGDGPDSTNHYSFWDDINDSWYDNTDMTAYPKGGPPGILANYPTVFDYVVSPIQGPCHVGNVTLGLENYVRLGINVSDDFNDADLLPDNDTVPNINVTFDGPDLESLDDGLINISVNVSPIDGCGTGNISFNVNGPTIFNETYYFNAWVDFNRDGDWEDNLTSCNQIVPEWIVKNMTITSPGIYYNDSWLAYIPNNDYRWVRMTLHPVIEPPITIDISNCDELQNMSNNLTAYYRLTNDVDCSGTTSWNYNSSRGVYEGFEPIGSNSNPFLGTFDGEGHKITGLYINRTTGYNGLFGYTGGSSIIRNVGLEDVNIDGAQYNNGGLVGSATYTNIRTSYVTGHVSGYDGVGCIAGYIGSSIVRNTYAYCNVKGYQGCGGLVGSSDGDIINSYAISSVNCSSASTTGGLVGWIETDYINDSFAVGNVNVGGGLVGSAKWIYNSYWNNHSGNPSVCVYSTYGDPYINCTAVQDNENYFYNASNAPMTSWDFFYPWNESINDYPTFKPYLPKTYGMNYDGSGPGYCFIGGETEDYYQNLTIEYFEVCDGQDNDNDGLSDEGFDGDNDGDYDDDNDGWGDQCDNCPDDYNPDQADICSPTGARGGGGGSVGRRLSVCAEYWECAEWGPCLSDGKQYRTCYDLNNCDELYNKKIIIYINKSVKPDEVRDCEYQPKCYDKIFNGNESDVDCGGLICPKCEDGKRCRVDEDCINLCNQTTKICYTPVRMPSKIKPALILIIAMASVILLILESLTFKYQKAFVLSQISNYKAEKAMRLKERKNELHRLRKEEYTKELNTFLINAVEAGYNKTQIKQLLISNGWPKRYITEYCNRFFKK